jgi:hypothetical protein
MGRLVYFVLAFLVLFAAVSAAPIALTDGEPAKQTIRDADTLTIYSIANVDPNGLSHLRFFHPTSITRSLVS